MTTEACCDSSQLWRGELNVVSQVKCCISRDEYVVETILQVQKGAPVDLLLGTDVLTQLGFIFSKVEKGGKLTCLLSVDSWTSAEVKRATDNITETGLCSSSSTAEAGITNVPEAAKTAMVKLIQATRLPAHHFKLVRVSMDDSKLYDSLCLFEPFLSSLHKMGVTISSGLVDAQGAITLLMKNQGAEPVLLERDIVVGCLG